MFQYIRHQHISRMDLERQEAAGNIQEPVTQQEQHWRSLLQILNRVNMEWHLHQVLQLFQQFFHSSSLETELLFQIISMVEHSEFWTMCSSISVLTSQ